MKNVVIYLIGFSGTGKYTIAKEILIVNHPNLMTLDITSLSPKKAAHTILSHGKNREA